MKKNLIIAEKPSVAADVAAALGGFNRIEQRWERTDLIISAAVGHLVQVGLPDGLPSYDLSSLPILPDEFSLNVIERTKARFSSLNKLLNQSDIVQVINACDAGREGELIFRLIYEKSDCIKPIKRMWFQSMTKEAIQEAYKTMQDGSNFDNLAIAARMRSEADLTLGVNGTRGISLLRKKETGNFEVYNAGRVQTPVLTLVVERHQAIKNFVSKPFWELVGHFKVTSGKYIGKLQDVENSSVKRFDNEDAATAAAQALNDVSEFTVVDDVKQEKKLPPFLFDLTSLQREANKQFNLSAKQALDITQALYETHKLVTYPRTDAKHLPEDYVDKCKTTLQQLKETDRFSNLIHDDILEFEPSKRIFDNKKISDHFAIIPTGINPVGLSDNEQKIYDLIARRFIAAFYPAAICNVTHRKTFLDGRQVVFATTGRIYTQKGWLVVITDSSKDKENSNDELCQLLDADEGKAQCQEIAIHEGKTTPPKAYKESSLLSAMEHAGRLVDEDDYKDAMAGKGIGTPATRAAIIEGLLSNKTSAGKPKQPYLMRESSGVLTPTDKAIDLIDFLKKNNINALVSPTLTGEWEHALNQVEKGMMSACEFKHGIFSMTKTIIETLQAEASNIKPKKTEINAKCPICQKAMHSFFKGYKCIDDVDCKYVLWDTIAGLKLTVEQAEKLLNTKQLPPTKGFVSKTGKKFKAGLTLSEAGKVDFKFEPAPSPSKYKCKACGKPLVHHTKSGKNGYNFWGCSGFKDGCKTSYPDKSDKPNYAKF